MMQQDARSHLSDNAFLPVLFNVELKFVWMFWFSHTNTPAHTHTHTPWGNETLSTKAELRWLPHFSCLANQHDLVDISSKVSDSFTARWNLPRLVESTHQLQFTVSHMRSPFYKPCGVNNRRKSLAFSSHSLHLQDNFFQNRTYQSERQFLSTITICLSDLKRKPVQIWEYKSQICWNMV